MQPQSFGLLLVVAVVSASFVTQCTGDLLQQSQLRGADRAHQQHVGFQQQQLGRILTSKWLPAADISVGKLFGPLLAPLQHGSRFHSTFQGSAAAGTAAAARESASADPRATAATAATDQATSATAAAEPSEAVAATPTAGLLWRLRRLGATAQQASNGAASAAASSQYRKPAAATKQPSTTSPTAHSHPAQQVAFPPKPGQGPVGAHEKLPAAETAAVADTAAQQAAFIQGPGKLSGAPEMRATAAAAAAAAGKATQETAAAPAGSNYHQPAAAAAAAAPAAQVTAPPLQQQQQQQPVLPAGQHAGGFSSPYQPEQQQPAAAAAASTAAQQLLPDPLALQHGSGTSQRWLPQQEQQQQRRLSQQLRQRQHLYRAEGSSEAAYDRDTDHHHQQQQQPWDRDAEYGSDSDELGWLPASDKRARHAHPWANRPPRHQQHQQQQQHLQHQQQEEEEEEHPYPRLDRPPRHDQHVQEQWQQEEGQQQEDEEGPYPWAEQQDRSRGHAGAHAYPSYNQHQYHPYEGGAPHVRARQQHIRLEHGPDNGLESGPDVAVSSTPNSPGMPGGYAAADYSVEDEVEGALQGWGVWGLEFCIKGWCFQHQYHQYKEGPPLVRARQPLYGTLD